MEGMLGSAMLWVKALHVIAIISWMAGMLYLPRLFAYHCEAERGSRQSETFKVMERRLLRIIINPAMGIAWLSGLGLAFHFGYWSEPWFHGKFALVVLLSGAHGFFARWRRQFEADDNRHGARFYKAMNEVPTFIMIGVVVLVIVRPFG